MGDSSNVLETCISIHKGMYKEIRKIYKMIRDIQAVFKKIQSSKERLKFKKNCIKSCRGLKQYFRKISKPQQRSMMKEKQNV